MCKFIEKGILQVSKEFYACLLKNKIPLNPSLRPKISGAIFYENVESQGKCKRTLGIPPSDHK